MRFEKKNINNKWTKGFSYPNEQITAVAQVLVENRVKKIKSRMSLFIKLYHISCQRVSLLCINKFIKKKWKKNKLRNMTKAINYFKFRNFIVLFILVFLKGMDF